MTIENFVTESHILSPSMTSKIIKDFMMSTTENDLLDLSQTAGILRRHSSLAVHQTAEALDNITGLIRLYHQPTCFRVAKVGYTCFKDSDQQILATTLASLKRIFRKARLLFRRRIMKKKIMDNLIENLEFTPDDLGEAMQLINILCGLVASERLLGYIPYMLGKIRRTKLWRQSCFAEMPWTELSVVLKFQNNPSKSSLDELLRRISLKVKFDLGIVKTWIHLAATMIAKDQYIPNTVKEHKIDRLCCRVQADGLHLDSFTSADTLEARAYRVAYLTFREDWFVDVGPYVIDLTDQAFAWFKRQVLREASSSMFVNPTWF